MRLIFKEKLVSILDSYKIFDEEEKVVYSVKGKFSLRKVFEILDDEGNQLALIKRRFFNFINKTYTIYVAGKKLGTIQKKFSWFKPKFKVNINNWTVDGNLFQYDYNIQNNEELVAMVSKKFVALTDTYTLDVTKEEDAFYAVLVVLVIDAEKSISAKKNRK